MPRVGLTLMLGTTSGQMAARLSHREISTSCRFLWSPNRCQQFLRSCRLEMQSELSQLSQRLHVVSPQHASRLCGHASVSSIQPRACIPWRTISRAPGQSRLQFSTSTTNKPGQKTRQPVRFLSSSASSQHPQEPGGKGREEAGGEGEKKDTPSSRQEESSPLNRAAVDLEAKLRASE